MSANLSTLVITQAKLLAYQLPFKNAMQFKQHKLHYREGLILQVTDQTGSLRFAEIAPLPGFSHETLSEVKQELIEQLPIFFSRLSEYKSSYNSVQLGLNCLLTEHTQNEHFQKLEMDNVPLLQGNKEQTLTQYLTLNKPELIKLKVARGSVEADIETFVNLCQLNPLLTIRCDANQAWSKQQATQFFNGIDIQRLDYIEEPTKSHITNLDLAEQHQVPLGLDETLQQVDFTYQHNQHIKAFIIKPTIIGNKEKIDQLVYIAQIQGIQVSFSSSFESVVGLQQLKQLALSYANHHGSHNLAISLGIDTLKYFNTRLLTDVQKIEQDSRRLEVLWSNN